MFRIWVICLALWGCSHGIVPPGELGIEFTGQWKDAPAMRVGNADKNHLFLIRLTGFVPRKAEHVVIRNEWGRHMVSIPIKWFDVMQTAPQRKYGTNWIVNVQTYHEVMRQKADNMTDEDVSETWKRTADGVYPGGVEGAFIVLRAEVHTQDEKVLASRIYRVTMECVSCGV